MKIFQIHARFNEKNHLDRNSYRNFWRRNLIKFKATRAVSPENLKTNLKLKNCKLIYLELTIVKSITVKSTNSQPKTPKSTNTTPMNAERTNLKPTIYMCLGIYKFRFLEVLCGWTPYSVNKCFSGSELETVFPNKGERFWLK